MKFFNRVLQNILRAFLSPSSAAKMRLSTSIILLTASICSYGQNLIGKYAAYYGHTLHLREDSTFRYEWKFDLASSWSVGKWTVSKGTVYLNIKNVLDTLVREGQPDSLVFSADENPNRISIDQFAMELISGGGQGRTIERIPERLAIRGKKLHPMDKAGKIVRRRESGIWNKRKRPTYYFKTI